MPCRDPEPACVGRFGYGVGYHHPEWAEDARAGLPPAVGCVACPAADDCLALSFVTAGIDLEQPSGNAAAALVARNLRAGHQARDRHAAGRPA